MKNFKLLSIIILSFTLFLSPFFSVFAVDTDSQTTATESGTTDAEAEDSLQERIKNTVQENLGQAEDSIRQKLEEKLLLGYTGTIVNIKENIITANTNNNLYQIIFDEDTAIVRKGNNIDSEDLSIDEGIIIMGYLSSDDILTARRIVTTDLTPSDTFRQTLIGPLQEIDLEQEILILLVDDQPIEIDIEDFDLDEDQTPNPQQKIMLIVDTDTEEDIHTLIRLQIL